MGRKKFCEICNLNIPYEDFKRHESSRNHRINKQNYLDYELEKNKKEKLMRGETQTVQQQGQPAQKEAENKEEKFLKQWEKK